MIVCSRSWAGRGRGGDHQLPTFPVMIHTRYEVYINARKKMHLLLGERTTAFLRRKVEPFSRYTMIRGVCYLPVRAAMRRRSSLSCVTSGLSSAVKDSLSASAVTPEINKIKKSVTDPSINQASINHQSIVNNSSINQQSTINQSSSNIRSSSHQSINHQSIIDHQIKSPIHKSAIDIKYKKIIE